MSNDPPARASLLGLPAELRNTIYQLILPETLQYLIFRDPHDLPRIPIAKEYHHAIPGTLQTCRRLRAEFLPVYYGTRKFSIIVIALSMSPNTALIKRPVQSLLTWLRELDGEARKALLHNVPSNTTISYKTNYRATEEWARTEYGPDLRGIRAASDSAILHSVLFTLQSAHHTTSTRHPPRVLIGRFNLA